MIGKANSENCVDWELWTKHQKDTNPIVSLIEFCLEMVRRGMVVEKILVDFESFKRLEDKLGPATKGDGFLFYRIYGPVGIVTLQTMENERLFGV